MRVPLFRYAGICTMISNTSSYAAIRHEPPLVVIVGATGTGKTKLSIDVATRFGGEVVNSDKIQVYRGLDITTNKVPDVERRGVRHHLLGAIDPAGGELSPSSYSFLAESAITSIAARGKLPILVGGSNSLIHALLSDPISDPFGGGGGLPGMRCRCCFICVGVAGGVLGDHLDRRVDEMIAAGMVEELEEYFAGDGGVEGAHPGLQKAIGVPEFRAHMLRRRSGLSEAVGAIKANTRRLATEQIAKIERLPASVVEGWGPMRNVDATAAVRAKRMRWSAKEAWRRDVSGPAADAVERFLMNFSSSSSSSWQPIHPILA